MKTMHEIREGSGVYVKLSTGAKCTLEGPGRVTRLWTNYNGKDKTKKGHCRADVVMGDGTTFPNVGIVQMIPAEWVKENADGSAN